jgi:hypothetical protein
LWCVWCAKSGQLWCAPLAGCVRSGCRTSALQPPRAGAMAYRSCGRMLDRRKRTNSRLWCGVVLLDLS